MEKYIYNEKNGLHYELVGDYYLPCLTIDEPEHPIGIWGQRRHLLSAGSFQVPDHHRSPRLLRRHRDERRNLRLHAR